MAPEWFVEDFDGDDDSRVVQAAMEQLPVDQREVLTLKIWGDLTFRAIAETLGEPLNTVASRYRYALEALRKVLEEIK
jgi:RNA polymerase sigma-70 factor (ECF subfamily)